MKKARSAVALSPNRSITHCIGSNFENAVRAGRQKYVASRCIFAHKRICYRLSCMEKLALQPDNRAAQVMVLAFVGFSKSQSLRKSLNSGR